VGIHRWLNPYIQFAAMTAGFEVQFGMLMHFCASWSLLRFSAEVLPASEYVDRGACVYMPISTIHYSPLNVDMSIFSLAFLSMHAFKTPGTS
jgi:hypothetical protein